MVASREPIWARRNRIFALVAGVCAALLGATALAGLFLNVEALKCIVPGSTPLKPNIAAGLFLCGFALALLSRGKIDKWIRYAVGLMTVVVLTLAVATLGEIFFDWDLGIDQVLVPTSSLETSSSLRMFPTAALCFLMAGSAILSAAQLSKPYNTEKLLATVKTAMETKSEA